MPYKFEYSYIEARAVLHAIGQVQDIFGRGMTTAEIARFWRVSKPTARKYMKHLVEYGQVFKKQMYHRRNVGADVWFLEGPGRKLYKDGALASEYRFFVRVAWNIVDGQVKNEAS